jgi:hypothetical protein
MTRGHLQGKHARAYADRLQRRRAGVAHGKHEERNGGQYDENWAEWYAEYIVREQSGEELPQ